MTIDQGIVPGLSDYWAASLLADNGELPPLCPPDAEYSRLAADIRQGREQLPSPAPLVYSFAHANLMEYFAAVARLDGLFSTVEALPPEDQVSRARELAGDVAGRLSEFQPYYGDMVLSLAEKCRLSPTAHSWLAFAQARIAHWRNGEHNAHALYERVYRDPAADDELSARSGHEIGFIFTVHLGRFQEAEDILLAANAAARRLGDTHAAIRSLLLLAQGARHLNRFHLYTTPLIEALRAIRPADDPDALLRAGILFRQQGYLRLAERVLRASIAGWTAAPLREIRLPEAHVALGDLLLAGGRVAEAAANYGTAVSMLERYRGAVIDLVGADNYGIRVNLGNALLGVAKILLLRGDAVGLQQAADHAGAALTLLSGDQVRVHEALALTLLVHVRSRQRRFAEAAHYYRQARELVITHGLDRPLLRVLAAGILLSFARRRPRDLLSALGAVVACAWRLRIWRDRGLRRRQGGILGWLRLKG